MIEELKEDARHIDEEVVKQEVAQFYTELNIDGRFLALVDNQWGLRAWYPVDQVAEEIVNPVKAKKKKKTKKVVADETNLTMIEEEEVDGLDDPEDLLEDDDDDEDLRCR